MMRLAMTFNIELYDFVTGEGTSLVSTPGDYIRMRKWADAEMVDIEDGSTLSNLRLTYALAWQALAREGRLAEFGLPGEVSVDAIDAMADRVSAYLEECGEEGDIASPLPGGAARE